MSQKSTFSKVIWGLVAGGLILPIAISVILALGALIGAMGDLAGAVALRYVALGCGIVWIIVLISLLLAQAVRSLGEGEEPDK